MTPKPGWKTTEFWMSVTAAIVGLLSASGGVGDESIVMKVAGMAGAALVAMGYAHSRGKAKGS